MACRSRQWTTSSPWQLAAAAYSFDGNTKKDPKCFMHWLQKVDSFIGIAKPIIGDGEIGIRLHAALEGDAAEYLEGIPAKTFGVADGWKALVRVLKEKCDEKKMHKVGSATKAFFRMQVDRNWTLTETMDAMDKAARLCKEAGLTLPDEIMTHFFFEHSGLEHQANVLLRTGGDYTWKKVKHAVELLYPHKTVSTTWSWKTGYTTSTPSRRLLSMTCRTTCPRTWPGSCTRCTLRTVRTEPV